MFASLRGQALYRLTLDPEDPKDVIGVESLLQDECGRLRDVIEEPDGALYVITSNLSRGMAPPEGDKLLRTTNAK